jgi:molybdopterin-guanine dinucleotide biosynthesis protein A
MAKQEDITGVILVGGTSSRMGRNKALLDLHGRSFIEHIAEALLTVFSKVFISSDQAHDYEFLKLQTIEDVHKRAGPLAGIHSALVHARTPKIFVVSCDLPLITPNLLHHVLKHLQPADATIVSVDGAPQPLLGVYDVSCHRKLEEHLRKGQYSVLRFLDDVTTHSVALESSRDLGHTIAVSNVNTPSDCAAVIAFAGGKD